MCMLSPQLVGFLERVKRYGLVIGGASLQVGFKVSKVQARFTFFPCPPIRMQSSQLLCQYHACELPALMIMD